MDDCLCWQFDKPGVREDDYPDWSKEAGEKALRDAGITYDVVEQACCSYVYGDTAAGQRAVYMLGMTGIPVYNVSVDKSPCCLWLYWQRS